MTARERMQLSRRRDPYPWTWEPVALAVVALLLLVVVGVQAGRGAANWIAGAGFTWPPSEDLVTSVVAVVGGDPAAGLPHPHRLARFGHLAPSGLLYTSLAVTEVVLLVGYAVGLVRLLRTWGPGRMLGMASREEAERLLGRTRLRKVAGVVRPDLYGRPARPSDPHPAVPWVSRKRTGATGHDPSACDSAGRTEIRAGTESGLMPPDPETALGRWLPQRVLPVRVPGVPRRSRKGSVPPFSAVPGDRQRRRGVSGPHDPGGPYDAGVPDRHGSPADVPTVVEVQRRWR